MKSRTGQTSIRGELDAVPTGQRTGGPPGKGEAACAGPPQELIQAYLEGAEKTVQQQQMAIAILEEWDHLEEITRPEQDPEDTDDVREMLRLVFYRVLERRPLHSGTWTDRKPIATIDQTLTEEHKKDLTNARRRNKAEAEGKPMEITWGWSRTLWTEKNRQRWANSWQPSKCT